MGRGRVVISDVESFLSLQKGIPILDVRSPGEFEQAHLPGAFSFPLFSNEERAEIGTLFKQVNPEEAFLRGLDLTGPKMSRFVRQAFDLAPTKQVALYCWRGGQRSGSMAWLLASAGMEVYQLQGGYKAFRQQVLQAIEQLDLPLLVVGGETGAQKTLLLHGLRDAGEQVIDLEDLANHRGSAFGALGQADQPSVEQFENVLVQSIQRLDQSRPVWIEDESKSIGKVYLPIRFREIQSQAPLIYVQVPIERRIQNLVQLYAHYSKDELVEAFCRIQKRLGGQHLKTALEALDNDDFVQAAKVALVYYDKAYRHKMDQRDGKIHHLQVTDQTNEELIVQLIDWSQNLK